MAAARRIGDVVIKVVLFVKRNEGWSREDFRRRYEEGHAPLARSVLPMLRQYTRSYVREASSGFEPDFDVITEFWFDSPDDWEAARTFAASEEGQVLARDEEVFMDRPTMRYLVVDEEVGPDPVTA
jgi:uncharacterized protein (TIGR02118 family)